MRVTWCVCLLTIAVAAPLGAYADSRVTPASDLWFSGRNGMSEDARLPAAFEAQSGPQDDAAVRAVDTFTPRVFEGSTSFRAVARPTAAPAQVAPVHAAAGGAPAAAAAPEMSTGLAAAALTLLFGGVAILRGRRTEFNAR
jgi:hypothetical protein